MSSEIDNVLELLRALLNGAELESDPLHTIDSLIERNELLAKRARGVALTLLEKERRLLEDIKGVFRTLKTARGSVANWEVHINSAANKHSQEICEESGLVLIEALRDYKGGEFGAIRKGDIAATAKEVAERLKKEGVARVVGRLR